jgi:hypothetical protein
VQFEFKVIEKRNYLCKYVVEAANLAEAIPMAEVGDTISSEDMRCVEVTQRYVVEVGTWDNEGEPLNE